MKESGINYFYNNLNLDTGSFAILYTFESNVGTNIPSISGAQSVYSGTLNTSVGFWSSPGSGYFNGNTVSINNASGLDSTSWTKIFLYEKVNVDACVLFDSMNGSTSGCRIGITKTNKPYFETFNQEPVVAASLNNYSSKNAISFTYLPNYLTIGLYNWNSKLIESESFTYPFGLTRSDNHILGTQFSGYIDTYIHLTQPLGPDVQSQLFSGFFAYPTGTGYAMTTTCTTGITGYQNIFVYTTGITGYTISPGGDDGQGWYTGAFPTTYSQTTLTGYLSTGLFISGLSGILCITTTGAQTVLFQYLTGYASSFGMEKIQSFAFLNSGDIIKSAVSYIPFDNIYNKTSLSQYSGYLMNITYDTGILDLYLNGVALDGQNWSITGDYIMVANASSFDSLFFDTKNGNKVSLIVTGAPSITTMIYTGQELYLNGINLISGYDYTQVGSSLNLTAVNNGVTGYLFEYPIVLTSQTGNYTIWTGTRFGRNTTNLYRNGIRQENRVLYIEGAIYDKLSGNWFNPSICSSLYADNNLYWE